MLFFFIREAMGHAAQDGTSSHRSSSAADASVQLHQAATLDKVTKVFHTSRDEGDLSAGAAPLTIVFSSPLCL